MGRNKPVFSPGFLDSYEKCDGQFRKMLDKAVAKILEKPGLGKPLRYRMAGTMSERVGSFRIIYEIRGELVIFHKFDSRKSVYR